MTPGGGELIELPQQPSTMNSIQRTAKLTLDATGMLKGDVREMRLGERASSERWRLRTVTKDTDRIKPIEELLGNSLASFRPTHASLINFQQTDQPFGFSYSFESPNYAKNAGNLLLVRPRVLGNKASGLLETKEPRRFPVEFEGPARDTDSFEITIPSGYVVDDIPPPVDAWLRQVSLEDSGKRQRRRLHANIRGQGIERAGQPGGRTQKVLSDHRER